MKFVPNFPTKLPWNWPFFLRICLWKSHKIWPFFRHLSEPLCYEQFTLIKVLDLVAFFSLFPHFFSFTNVNNVQSGHLRIWPDKSYFWPDKSYFWPDIVYWPAVISSPHVGVPSWFCGSWVFSGYPGFYRFTALDWAPFNFCQSTALYSLQFIVWNVSCLHPLTHALNSLGGGNG